MILAGQFQLHLFGGFYQGLNGQDNIRVHPRLVASFVLLRETFPVNDSHLLYESTFTRLARTCRDEGVPKEENQ